jgi:hypothetical protein
MKQMICKALLAGTLMLINISVFGQSLPDSTYYLNSSSGTFSATGSAYTGIRTKAWVINIGTQKPVKIDFDVDIMGNTDFIDIYAVTASGSEYLMLTLTGTKVGSISTVLPTGKAKVKLRINYGSSGYFYDGLTASYSADNVITNTSISDNAYVNKDMSVLGNVGIGTAGSDYSKLSIYGAAQYGINSVVNGTNTRRNYGIYSSASRSNNSYLYGIYSTVSGTGTDVWAGYFTGGKVEIDGGVLKANNGLTVGDSAIFNGKVGIGTTTPAYKLDVNGTSRTTGNAIFSGDVGIGTTTPEYKLDVSGTSRTTGNAIFSGDVGIGTTTPEYKLDVNGIIRATEVKIETDGADFVFDDSYRLKPLPEVESFIKANKHLPEIPSAIEMKKNEGIGIGEMQTKLLQKIEELTLYLIRQENTIQELKSEIRELKEK